MAPTYYDLACDKDFWIKLNPDLHIEGVAAKNAWSPLNLQKNVLEDLKKDMVQDGYFVSEPVLDPAEMAKLTDAVKVLALEQWPTIFAMVYDEFWQVYQRAGSVLNHILGSNYRQLPNFWVYHIAPDHGGSGWAPHRDRAQTVTIRPDGMPNSMTIWIALNDATLWNGCMYVLPARRDLNYPHSPWNFELGVKDLQSIRALPAKTGSILSWNESLIHWGAKSSDKAHGPRVSAACAFQRADIDPLETPVLDPYIVPTFKTRLGIIGQQLFRFAIHTGMPEAVRNLAQELGKLSETIQIYDQSNPYRGAKAGKIKVAK
ncbi:MAG: phytanoyl-CoA dioxygenase family protein [Candidatus Melainabacteria bacterium]|nr:phytanoyl-CoA dioxygenase family protein [Candidatus Melainabacteria bacterium]